MRKQLLCAALWAGALCAPLYATAGSWNFNYQGFYNVKDGQFQPQAGLGGSFSGEDLNHDQVISRDELTGFHLDGITYIGELSCMDGSGHTACSIDRFSYTLAGQLDFSAHANTWDGVVNFPNHYVAGDYFSRGFDSPWYTDETRYEWTGQTTFTISPAPVPEPAMVLLVPAGLAALLTMRRRVPAIAPARRLPLRRRSGGADRGSGHTTFLQRQRRVQ